MFKHRIINAALILMACAGLILPVAAQAETDSTGMGTESSDVSQKILTRAEFPGLYSLLERIQDKADSDFSEERITEACVTHVNVYMRKRHRTADLSAKWSQIQDGLMDGSLSSREADTLFTELVADVLNTEDYAVITTLPAPAKPRNRAYTAMAWSSRHQAAEIRKQDYKAIAVPRTHRNGMTTYTYRYKRYPDFTMSPARYFRDRDFVGPIDFRRYFDNTYDLDVQWMFDLEIDVDAKSGEQVRLQISD